MVIRDKNQGDARFISFSNKFEHLLNISEIEVN